MERLAQAVASEKGKHPDTFQHSANTKLLAALEEIVFRRIPSNPADRRYRQGDALGEAYRHWFRDKFGGGRFRVFFRYHAASKIIIYAWVNDDRTLRTYGAKTDAYAVFAGMLDSGNPPDTWSTLLQACSKPTLIKRVKAAQGSGDQ